MTHTLNNPNHICEWHEDDIQSPQKKYVHNSVNVLIFYLIQVTAGSGQFPVGGTGYIACLDLPELCI